MTAPTAGAATAGPWLVNPVSAWIEIPNADAPICALLWPTDLRSEDETFANGRLISAAPDLLSALLWLRAFWRPGSGHDTREVKLALAAADTAIAKARATGGEA
jgi:hypothetical protein